MHFDADQIHTFIFAYVVPFFWRILGGIVLWILGRWLIRLVDPVFQRVLTKRELDPTLALYISSVVGGLLTILLGIAVLSVVGVETTSFAALLAAAGVAIGMAWSGLLSNFAAGVFLITLRPFKVGDYISAGGVNGTVSEIGLFGTTMNMDDNVRAIIGNNKIFSGNILNYSANAYRRVDLSALVPNGVDVDEAKVRLLAAVTQVKNVLASPPPCIEITDSNALGTVLCVRPYSTTSNYWQVYFDTNKAIGAVAKAANWPVPEARQAVRTIAA